MKSFFAAAAVSFLLALSSAASADDPITSYNDDQLAMECAKINSDLDHGNCVS